MPDILSGEEGYMYAGRGSTFQGGNPASDKQIPVNPVLSFTGPLVEYIQKQVTTTNKKYHNIEFDERLEAGNCTLRTYFRDPIMMFLLFGYCGITTAWTGTADVITATFANANNQDNNIFLQVFERDQSGKAKHNSLLFDGGIGIEYRWIINQQDGMFEEIDFLFTEVSENEQPVDIDTNFDDTSFNATGVAEISTVVCVAKASIVEESYFILYVISAAPYTRTRYNIWFDVVGDGIFTASPGVGTDVKCDVSGAGDATTVAVIVAAAIDGISADVGAGSAVALVTITNVNEGDIEDITDVNSLLVVGVTTQGVVPLDGGWSNWDDEYGTDDVVLTHQLTIIWNGVAIAGFELQSGTLRIPVPKELIYVQSQLKAKDWLSQVRGPYTFECRGILTANTNIAEAIAALSSKTQGTLKITYGTTNVGYIQFTNGYLKMDPLIELPEAGKVAEVSITVHGGKDSIITYYWTGNVVQDPSAMINHTDI